MTRLFPVGCVILTATFLLSGCDSVRRTFGLDHYQADEMQADPNPPLTTPPNLKLRPPRPGEPNPNIEKASIRAEKALGNRTHPGFRKAAEGTVAEDTLLKKSQDQAGTLPEDGDTE